VDFAVHQIEKHLQNLPESERTEEALAKFNERGFFEGMRATHPYLFGIAQVPATTGTGATNAQPPRPPRATQQAAGGTVDAMKMTQDEYQEHLRKLGIGIAAPVAGNS